MRHQERRPQAGLPGRGVREPEERDRYQRRRVRGRGRGRRHSPSSRQEEVFPRRPELKTSECRRRNICTLSFSFSTSLTAAAIAVSLRRGVTAKEAPFLFLRAPELLFALAGVLFLFSFIYATNANMDYVQRFMATHGNLRLAPNSSKERLTAYLRYLPLLAVDAAVIWYFRSRGSTGRVEALALPAVNRVGDPVCALGAFVRQHRWHPDPCVGVPCPALCRPGERRAWRRASSTEHSRESSRP